LAKNSNQKKNFEIVSAIVNYIFNVFLLACLIYYKNILDLNFRTKSLFFLMTISPFKILIGSTGSGLIIPILMFFINFVLNLLIYMQFENSKENYMMIFLSLFKIIIVTCYKRKIDELNRTSFIQQHILKKYFLYNYDLLNNMNGFHFSLHGDLIIKINKNLKAFLNNINHIFNDKLTKIQVFKSLLNSELKDKEENKNSVNILRNIERQTNHLI